MDKMRRSERTAAIARMLTREPGRLFTLREFVDTFVCAKSTLSEDIASVRSVFLDCGLGVIESVNGAAGGVRFYPFDTMERDAEFVRTLCGVLRHSERLLDGDFLYTLDILSDPAYLNRMGEIFAKKFASAEPEVVLTAESMGVPVAMATAQALGIPFITAKREARIWYGPAVTINYMSTSGRHVQTMSLPKRILSEGKRVLIIDDFMRAGGTLRALCSMLSEFRAELCGIGVIIAKGDPSIRAVPSYSALIELKAISKESGVIDVAPAGWLTNLDRD